MKKKNCIHGIGIMGSHMATHLINKFGNINIVKEFTSKYEKNSKSFPFIII